VEGWWEERRKKLYLCFVDHKKAFDRVRHDKLAEVMEKTGIPDLEMRLIMDFCWHQHASVGWEEEVGRDFRVERG
jgi:hypothetical protein